MAEGSSPAHAIARRAATVASSAAGAWEMRRSFMPVRLVIHASSVARNVARSALVSTAGGIQAPQPVIAALVMGYQKITAKQMTSRRKGRHDTLDG